MANSLLFFLQNWSILCQLESWKLILKADQRGPSAETHFFPKRYLFDIGIAKDLREAAWSQTKLISQTGKHKRDPLGGIMENLTALTLMNLNLTRDLSGWKKAASGSEVDLVIKIKNAIIPVECKAALKLKNTHLGGIKDFLSFFSSQLGIVVSLAPFEIKTFSEGKIINIPLYLIEQMESIIDNNL